MEDQNTGVNSVAEMMAEDDHRGKRALVQLAAGILISVGLLFTGYMNFMLYSRAFSDTLKVLGLIPAFLIEGSLAVFMLGSFVWYSAGVQGTLAKLFGWAVFGVVALNGVVEFNALSGGMTADNEFLRLYSFWGVPIVIPTVIGFWKAVIDADPAIRIMRQKRKIQQTLQLAQMDALMVALGKETSRAALTEFGDRSAETINARLRGSDVIDGAVRVSRNGHKPADAPTVTLAKDDDAGDPAEVIETPKAKNANQRQNKAN